MILAIGSILKDDKGNEYVLDTMIGKGGFGYVFKAHRIGDEKIFAIKTMLPAFTDNTNIISFKNEISSALSVKGEGIIKYIFAHNGDLFAEYPPYIIMEYADGGTLRNILDTKKKNNELFTNEEILYYFKSLALGMKTVNSALIHRDIKPENILLCGSQVKITDFGLAKLAIESTRTFTFKGAGTPLYMSPEAWDYSKNTIQMDMYSMGLVFYEIATLSFAYENKPNSYEEAKKMHMFDTVKKPSLINKNISPAIDSIICRMTEKRSAKRFSDWDEIIDAIEKQEDRDDSFLDRIVDNAIASKNADYLKKTELQNIENKKRKEEENFINNVRNLFEAEILQLLRQYTDKVNQSYAGQDKMSIKYNRGLTTLFSCIMESGNGKKVELDCKIVLEDSYQRESLTQNIWGEGRAKKRESYTPSYKNRKIMFMCEMRNMLNYGYNLLLVESDNLFGDWIIMKNYNNFSFAAPGKERREPFSFSLDELPDEIVKVQCTHLYRSDFEEYDEEDFISLINMLITM